MKTHHSILSAQLLTLVLNPLDLSVVELNVTRIDEVTGLKASYSFTIGSREAKQLAEAVQAAFSSDHSALTTLLR